MVNPRYEQGPPTMFICGNSPEVKRPVGEVLRQFGWKPFDCGGIVAARAIEPLCMLWFIPGFLWDEWTHAADSLKAASQGAVSFGGCEVQPKRLSLPGAALARDSTPVP